jgi:hypothetical protein
MTGYIQVILAAVAQHVHHVVGGYVERTNNTSFQVEVAVGTEDNIRAANCSE